MNANSIYYCSIKQTNQTKTQYNKQYLEKATAKTHTNRNMAAKNIGFLNCKGCQPGLNALS
jgi:hydroxylamine reductase (hybrid-cluster protein)